MYVFTLLGCEQLQLLIDRCWRRWHGDSGLRDKQHATARNNLLNTHCRFMQHTRLLVPGQDAGASCSLARPDAGRADADGGRRRGIEYRRCCAPPPGLDELPDEVMLMICSGKINIFALNMDLLIWMRMENKN